MARAKSRGESFPARTRTARRDLLTENPILWLRRSRLGTPWAAWLVVGLWGFAMAIIFVFEPGSGLNPGRRMTPVHVETARVFGFFLKLLFALQACRFFADARRDGTLELLLCTPLSNQDIIQGQMKALWRSYRWPFFALVIILFLPIFVRAGLNLFQPLSDSFTALGSTILAGVFVVRMAVDVVAILWFGTGLALTSRRPSLAPAWTVLLVLVLPSPLSFCWLDVLVDLGLISWGTNKCRLDLRRLVAEQYQAFSQPAPLTYDVVRLSQGHL